MSLRLSIRTSRGFTLVEVLIALALFVTIATGVAQLVALATRAMRTAREHTMAVMLAAAKMDQLRALEWTYERTAPGDPIVERSDRTTNVSAPGMTGAGSGLSVSPVDSLSSGADGFADYLDDSGRWVGAGATIAPGAVFIRRWSIRPLAAAPERTLVIQVLVTTVKDEHSRAGPWAGRTGADALLTTVRTRKRE